MTGFAPFGAGVVLIVLGADLVVAFDGLFGTGFGQAVVDEDRIGIVTVGSQVEEEIGRDLLFGVLDVVDREAALLGGQVDQYLVVEAVAQLFGDEFADGSSAAAVFAADCNDPVLHLGPSLLIPISPGVSEEATPPIPL